MDSEDTTRLADSQNASAPTPEGSATPPDAANAATDSVDAAAMEKRFKDAQAELTRKSMAFAELEKQNSELRNDVLKKLANAVDSNSKRGPTPEDIAAQEDALVRELRDGGEAAVLKVIQRNNEALAAALRADEEERRRKDRVELDSYKQELQALRRQCDPMFVANRDKIKALTEQGISEEIAYKAVQVLSPTIPDGSRPPTGTAPTRKSEQEPPPVSDAEVAQFAKLMGGPDKVKPEEIAAFRKRGQA